MAELEFDISMKDYEELIRILEYASQPYHDVEIIVNARYLLKIFREKE